MGLGINERILDKLRFLVALRVENLLSYDALMFEVQKH